MSNVQYKQPCRHDDWTKTVSSRRSSIIVIENENENENIRCGHGVRHMVGNEPKTSMIVLCEDGSLIKNLYGQTGKNQLLATVFNNRFSYGIDS